MGQKIHPQGLRVGLARKWNSNWFAVGSEWKTLFFYQKEVENFFKSLLYFYPYTKISRQKRVLFVFFYKFRTTRRKEIRPILSTIKQNTYLIKFKFSDNFEKKTLVALNKKAYFYKTKIL